MIKLTGTVSFGDIKRELGYQGTTFSISRAEGGFYTPINQNSQYKPSGLQPNGIEEWRGYIHTTGCACFRITNDGNIGGISYSFIPCGETQSVVGTIPQGDYVDICAEAGSVNTIGTVTLPPEDCCSVGLCQCYELFTSGEGIGGTTFTYLNCDGQTASVFIDEGNNGYTICAKPKSIVMGGDTGSFSPSFINCCEETTTTTTTTTMGGGGGGLEELAPP